MHDAKRGYTEFTTSSALDEFCTKDLQDRDRANTLKSLDEVSLTLREIVWYFGSLVPKLLCRGMRLPKTTHKSLGTRLVFW